MTVIDDERTAAESLAMALTSRSFGHWTVHGITAAAVLSTPSLLDRVPASVTVIGAQRPAQRQLLALLSSTHVGGSVVVLLPGGEDVDELPLLAQAGVRGWASRTDTLDHLNRVIQEVIEGGWWLPRWVLGDALASLREAADQRKRSRFESLTPRERQVLTGLMSGMSKSAIAHHHHMSVNTVRTHVQHVLEKLDVHTSLEAVVLAQWHDLSVG